MSDIGLPFATPGASARDLGRAGRAVLDRLKRAGNPSDSEILAQLREALSAYRRAKTDLSLPAYPASELFLLVNRYRAREFTSGNAAKIATVIIEIDDELATAMPVRRAPPRRWA